MRNMNMLKKLFLLTFCLLFIMNNNAQSFTQITNENIEGFADGEMAFEDIDNDGDLDLLISGYKYPGVNSTRLYKNDGTGNFTMVVDAGFLNFTHSSISFGDVDGDNDSDVIVTGAAVGTFSPEVTYLYLNDGQGNFTHDTNNEFAGVADGDVSLIDLDNDGDLDLYVDGDGIVKLVRLYLNNGLGDFSLLNNTITPTWDGESVFADIDGDGDQDLLVTGRDDPFGRIAKLYENDGLGGFSLLNDSVIDGVIHSSISFGDIDNDSDLDLFVNGMNILGEKTGSLYENIGLGEFSLLDDSTIQGTWMSDSNFGDMDNDNDLDLLISGWDIDNNPITQLYLNDGYGNFSISSSTSFTGLFDGTICLGDIDNDSDLDVAINGSNSSYSNYTYIYQNNHIDNIGLVEQNVLNKVYLYPNPSSSTIQLSVDNIGEYNIEIFNSSGSILDQFASTSKIIVLDISSYPKGLYFIQVSDDVNSKYLKFVVE